MSIQSEITRLSDNISSAYSVVSAKGGTLPATQNSQNLASAIQSISSGGTEYTAGANVEISDDNVINVSRPLSITNATYIKNGLYNNLIYDVYSVEDFYKYLRKGWIVHTPSSWTTANVDFRKITGTTDTGGYIYTLEESRVMTSSYVSNFSNYSIVKSKHYCYTSDVIVEIKDPSGAIMPCLIPYSSPSYSFVSGKNSLYHAIENIYTTRIADALVAEETTPTVNNTINWVYE